MSTAYKIEGLQRLYTNDDAFAAHLAKVRCGVDAALSRMLYTKTEDARCIGRPPYAAASAVSALAMRGGKRQRPAILAAAYEACGGSGGPDAVVMAGVALELLQTYFLVHDDWMDDADTRRGGPSVHVTLAETFGGAKKGNAAAILAGDHACALAQEALLELPLPAECIVAAVRELARIQQDVIAGQLLDIAGDGENVAAVEKMHDLKTGSYTVRGPLELGALLAGASPTEHDALASFAKPLGVAFQLRDDLLGTFGDPRITGKPRAPVAWMLVNGARKRVEDRIAGLVDRAVAAITGSSFTPHGKTLLAGAARALAYREQ